MRGKKDKFVQLRERKLVMFEPVLFVVSGETGLESLCLTTEGKQGVFGPKCNVTSELETG